MQSATLSCGEPLALWYDLVRDGASRAGTRLPESVESYLVFVLQLKTGSDTVSIETASAPFLLMSSSRRSG